MVSSTSSWIDPNTATNKNGQTPGGTATYKDARGRVVATDDPLFNEQQTPGVVMFSAVVIAPKW